MVRRRLMEAAAGGGGAGAGGSNGARSHDLVGACVHACTVPCAVCLHVALVRMWLMGSLVWHRHRWSSVPTCKCRHSAASWSALS